MWVYVLIVLMVCEYNASLGAVFRIYVAELCIDKAAGFVMFLNSVFTLTMSFTISYMLESPLGVQYTFVVYAGLNFIACLYSLFLVKETKGKTPVELHYLYHPRSVKK